MKIMTLQRVAAAVACLGMIVPSAWSAEAPAQPAAASLDVSLGAEGLFRGQLLDAQGVAQKGVEVAMLYNGREVVRTTTDENGAFAAKGLRGGEYQVVAMNQAASYRLWNAGQAPPAARPSALMIANTNVVNGQYSGGVLNWMKMHPLIVAGVVATAVAVPVAINASDDDSSS